MPNWDINTIISDLKTIVGVININQQTEEVPHLAIQLGGCDDWLFVLGIDDDAGNIYAIELSDDEGIGLNSHDFRLARLFIEVRQYFLNRGFDVFTSYEAY